MAHRDTSRENGPLERARIGLYAQRSHHAAAAKAVQPCDVDAPVDAHPLPELQRLINRGNAATRRRKAIDAVTASERATRAFNFAPPARAMHDGLTVVAKEKQDRANRVQSGAELKRETVAHGRDDYAFCSPDAPAWAKGDGLRGACTSDKAPRYVRAIAHGGDCDGRCGGTEGLAPGCRYAAVSGHDVADAVRAGRIALHGTPGGSPLVERPTARVASANSAKAKRAAKQAAYLAKRFGGETR